MAAPGRGPGNKDLSSYLGKKERKETSEFKKKNPYNFMME